MDCKQFEETNNEFEQRIEMAAAKLNWHYQGETHIAFENGYIAGARAEHKYVEPIKLELQKLQNDLDDALDIKNGKGPTALSRLSNELQKQKELNAELVKRIEELTPRASEKYVDNLTRKYGE